MAEDVKIQVDSEGVLSEEGDKYVSENGGVINPKFIEFLKKKVADEYRSNPKAYKIASKRINKVVSAYLADESEAYNACFNASDFSVDFNRRLFDKLKISGDGSDTITPILDISKMNQFIECGTHELNHAATTRMKVLRNRNGKFKGRAPEFSIGINSNNIYAMEALNTLVTANQTDIPSEAYVPSVCGCFPLNLILGKNVLQDLSVISPESIIKTVNHLSQDSDYFGKINVLSAIANYYEDELIATEDEDVYKEMNKKYNETLEAITALATRDLLIPFLSDYPDSIIRKDKVIEMVRSNQGATSTYLDLLIYWQVISNRCESFEEYRKCVDQKFEKIVSEANGLGYQLDPNGPATVVIAGTNATNFLSPYITRQLVGLNEYVRLDEDTKRAYEEYVQRTCDSSDGCLEFESKPIKSDYTRITGRYIPDLKSQRDIYLFDYVASKLGYRLGDFKTYLAKDSTVCTVEKKLERDSAELESAYQMANDELWNCVSLYEGNIYYSNPELDFEK